MKHPVSILTACLASMALLGVAFKLAMAEGESAGIEWATFHSSDPAFHFEYPKGWKINTATSPVMHYRNVFATVNNFGQENFEVREIQTSASAKGVTLEFNDKTTQQQLPHGAVYIDFGRWDGPPNPQPVPDTTEKEFETLLAKAQEIHTTDKDLFQTTLEFRKDGMNWSITAYLRAPVGEESREIVRHILSSFHADPPKKQAASPEK